MAQIIVDLKENQKKTILSIKKKLGLKTEAQVFDFLLEKYLQEQEEPAIKESYVKKIRDLEKQGSYVLHDSVSGLKESLEKNQEE